MEHVDGTLAHTCVFTTEHVDATLAHHVSIWSTLMQLAQYVSLCTAASLINMFIDFHPVLFFYTSFTDNDQSSSSVSK